MRTLSNTALQSAFAQQTAEVWLILLKMSHPSLPDDVRIVNNYTSVTSGGDLYIALPFVCEFPTEDPDSPGEARIYIDNIDRTIVNAIREMDTPPSITLQVVLASQPNTVEASFAGMTLRDCKWDVQAVSGVLRFEDISTEPVSVQMTPQRFPGMF
jgi:hypothetical protein